MSRLRFRPPTDEPLILPSWLPPTDRETLLAFYQQVLDDRDPLLRIEVDWDYRIVPGDASYLRDVRQRHGAERDLVVVRVRRAGVDLEEVAATPELTAFQYVAIACDLPAVHETVGRLGELAALVAQTAEELYEELAAEHGFRPDGPALVAPLVRSFVNPIPILETYNALIRLSVEPTLPGAGERAGAGDPYRDAIYRSVLGQVLDDLPVAELVGLTAIVLRGAGGLDEALGEQGAEVDESLRARMLIVDRRLIRWARFLEEPPLRDLVKDRIEQRAAPTPRVAGLEKVQAWLTEGRPVPSARDPIRADVLSTFSWLREGKLTRVADTLTKLEARLDEPGVTDATRGYFWDAVGRLRAQEGRWPEAEPAFRKSLALLESGSAGLMSRGMTMHELARGLMENGRWPEAEPLFRQALKLKEEGRDTPVSRAITMRAYAEGLRAAGRVDEALELEEEAAKLDPKG